MQDPDLQEGLNYWSALPATDDTVLGGFAFGVRLGPSDILFLIFFFC